MATGFLDKLRKKVIPSFGKEEQRPSVNLDDKIALGVLLWMVAQADEKFLPAEEKKIKDVLREHGHISEEDIPLVLDSIAEAEKESIDLRRFTKEVGEDLSYAVKKEIVANLFRVACSDGQLDTAEHETIRKISGLLWIDHKDFIDLKIFVKNEFGIKTLD